jgi:hypothetical protein
VLPTSIDAPEFDATTRILEVKRRLRDGYYDRPEVRRILCSIILRRLIATNSSGDREHPDSA